MTVLAQVETLARIPVNDLRRSWVATSPEVQEAAGRVIDNVRAVAASVADVVVPSTVPAAFNLTATTW